MSVNTAASADHVPVAAVSGCRSVAVPIVSLVDAAALDDRVVRSDPLASMVETQCLYGERFDVQRSINDTCIGELLTDGYQGAVPASALAPATTPTHRVTVPQTVVTATPEVKSECVESLYYGSQVQVLSALQDGGSECIEIHGRRAFIPAHHIAPLHDTIADWVSDAELFSGCPYLWGGRSASGLDCSALVQLTLSRAGLFLPRNSSDQFRAVKAMLLPESRIRERQLKRGDLIFWAGHVGIMRDSEQLLHANAYHRSVQTEPLQSARQRIMQQGGGDITGWARPLQ